MYQTLAILQILPIQTNTCQTQNENLQRVKISLQTNISRLFALLKIIKQSKVPNSTYLLAHLSLLPYFLISPHYQAQSKATYAFLLR